MNKEIKEYKDRGFIKIYSNLPAYTSDDYTQGLVPDRITGRLKTHIYPAFGSENPDQAQRDLDQSVYYWWWKYLQHNDAYNHFRSKGIVKSKQQKVVFNDFGKENDLTFEVWWKENFFNLFSKQFTRGIFANLDSPEALIAEANSFNPNMYVYVKVPITNMSKAQIKQEFNSFLSGYHQGKSGSRTQQNTIELKYPVLGKVKVEGLGLHLKVYELHKKLKSDGENMTLWKIAQKCDLFSQHTEKEKYLKIVPDCDTRNVMSSEISRHLKKARALIKNVGFGRFPDYT